MKNVIVTGGTGFIGSWLIQELLNNGIMVTAIVRQKNRLLSDFSNHPLITVIEKSIENICTDDFELMNKYDAFFHLGWSGVSPESKNILDKQLANIKISLHALEICKKIECKKFIASGTVAEYVFCTDIMNLNAKQSPNDLYGATKVSVHYFLEVRARQLNQFFNWIIIPSTFGERRNDNNIITYTIRTLLRKELPQYGSLEQMWDFLYVEEVVRAIRLIGEYGKKGKVYGIGSGQYKPLKEYIEIIRDLIDPALPLGIGMLPSMSKQTFSSCVDIKDLIQDTGFTPNIDFKTGIIKTIRYLKHQEL